MSGLQQIEERDEAQASAEAVAAPATSAGVPAEAAEADPGPAITDLDARAQLARRRAEMPALPGGLSRQAWLVTFSDLVALLITFFVMLLSMSTIDPEAWAALSGKSRATGGEQGAIAGAAPGTSAEVSLVRDDAPRAETRSRYLASVLRSHLARLEAAGLVEAGTAATARIDPGAERTVIRMPASILDGGPQGPISDVMNRIVEVAPGRLTIIGPVMGGDAQDWRYALSAVPAVDGVTAGVAGWVEPGEIALVIREQGTARGEGGG